MKKIIIFVLGLLLLSGCTFFTSAPGTYKYGEFEITKVKEGGYTGYVTKVFINNNQNPTYINTRHDPKSLEDINIQDNVRELLLTKKELYLHINDENMTGFTTVAGLEFNNLMERFYSIPVKYEENKFSCDDVNNTVGVVELQLGASTRIFTKDNCVVLQGSTEKDIIRASDRVIFFLLGIMKE